MTIRIKPSHEGRLHRALHIAAGKPIPERRLQQAEHSRDPATRREAVFAESARKWDHPKGGKK